MFNIGDRVRYNLSRDYPWFWHKLGTIVGFTQYHLLVLFDEKIKHPGAYFHNTRELEMGKECLEIIKHKEPDWEV